MRKFIGLIIVSALAIAAGLLPVELESKSLLDDKISLKIPKDFEIMENEMMELKYPSSNRPTLVYTNESGGINVALNHTQNAANQAAMGEVHKALKGAFTNLYPSADWKGDGVKEINGKKVGYMKLISPAIDTEIYNCMFYTDVDGRLLLCTFNCTINDMDEWATTADQIMNSLTVK